MERKDPIQIGLLFLRLNGLNLKNPTTTSTIAWLITFIFSCGMSVLIFVQSYLNENDHSVYKTVQHETSNSMHLTGIICYKLYENLLRDLLRVEDFWPIDYVNEKIKNEQLRFYHLAYNIVRLETVCALLSTFTTIMYFGMKPDGFYCHYYNNVSPCFEVMLVLSSIFVYTTSIFVNGYNVLFYGFFTFAFCQMKMLKEAFKSIYDEDNEEKKKEMFKTYIEHHQKILLYVKKINKAYSWFLLNFILTISTTCPLLLFYLVKKQKSDYILILVSFFMTFMPQCVFVTLVTNEIESLSTSFYESNWVNHLNINTRIELTMVIHRSQIGYDFKAGGIVKINMELVTTVVNYIISIYTLLKTL